MFNEAKLVIFDLDCLLIDSKELHYEALNEALRSISSKFEITPREHATKYDGLSTKKKLEMKIKKWHAIAEWTWGAEDDVCGICHSKFDQCAPDCKFPGDDSPVVWGTCSHAFHLKCIQKWLDNGSMSAHDQHVAQAEQKCPICRGDWSFKQA